MLNFQKKKNRKNNEQINCQSCWYMPIISALRKLKEEDTKFKDSLGCEARLCHQETKETICGEGLQREEWQHSPFQQEEEGEANFNDWQYSVCEIMETLRLLYISSKNAKYRTF